MKQELPTLSFDFNVNSLIINNVSEKNSDVCIEGAPPCVAPPCVACLVKIESKPRKPIEPIEFT